VIASGTGSILIKDDFYVVDGTFNCGRLNVNAGDSAVA